MRLLRPDSWRALAAYARLRRRLASTALAPAPGYRAGFLDGLDPLIARPLAAVFAEHFPRADPGEHAGILERSERLARFVAAPLEQPAIAGLDRTPTREPASLVGAVAP